jgi:Protein of unknown function (DUF433)
VSRIACWYKMGMTPEEIALEYPHLTLAQAHAALTYYHANRDEIEAGISRDEAVALEWMRYAEFTTEPPPCTTPAPHAATTPPAPGN